jgi:hypothetical protein
MSASSSPARSCPERQWPGEGVGGLGVGREMLRGELAVADAEVNEVFSGVEGDIADGTELGRDDAADMFVGGGGLEGLRGTVGEKLPEIDADNLRGTARATTTATAPAAGTRGGRVTGGRR